MDEKDRIHFECLSIFQNSVDLQVLNDSFTKFLTSLRWGTPSTNVEEKTVDYYICEILGCCPVPKINISDDVKKEFLRMRYIASVSSEASEKEQSFAQFRIDFSTEEHGTKLIKKSSLEERNRKEFIGRALENIQKKVKPVDSFASFAFAACILNPDPERFSDFRSAILEAVTRLQKYQARAWIKKYYPEIGGVTPQTKPVEMFKKVLVEMFHRKRGFALQSRIAFFGTQQ